MALDRFVTWQKEKPTDEQLLHVLEDFLGGIGEISNISHTGRPWWIIELFESTGVLRYSFKEGYGYRLVLEIDKDIVKYYRSLIPPWKGKPNPQMYDAHVSVVRKEVPPNLDAWGKYEGEEVRFLYSNHIYNGTVYWWLNVFCVRLEEIRVELGLPVSSQYTIPPEGFDKVFHCTLGNCK